MSTISDYLKAVEHREFLIDMWIKASPNAGARLGVARSAQAFMLEPGPLIIEVYSQTIPKTIVLAQQQVLMIDRMLTKRGRRT